MKTSVRTHALSNKQNEKDRKQKPWKQFRYQIHCLLQTISDVIASCFRWRTRVKFRFRLEIQSRQSSGGGSRRLTLRKLKQDFCWKWCSIQLHSNYTLFVAPTNTANNSNWEVVDVLNKTGFDRSFFIFSEIFSIKNIIRISEQDDRTIAIAVNRQLSLGRSLFYFIFFPDFIAGAIFMRQTILFHVLSVWFAAGIIVTLRPTDRLTKRVKWPRKAIDCTDEFRGNLFLFFGR